MNKDFIKLLTTYKKGESLKLNVICVIFNTKKHFCNELIETLHSIKKHNQDLSEVINELEKNTYFRGRIEKREANKSFLNDTTAKVIPGLTLFTDEVKRETNENKPKEKIEVEDKVKEKKDKKIKKKKKPIEIIMKKLQGILYKPIQCKICALRFDTNESELLSLHLQDHQRKLRSTEHHTSFSREYASKESEWLVTKINLPSFSNTYTKVKSDKMQDCKMCKEKIQLKFDDEEEEWILNDGIKTEEGFFYHRKCVE
ncbi:hypothetical protein H312_02704, partial [Anncaliia algerae PRA339]